MIKLAKLLWPFTLIFSCKPNHFTLEPPDYTNLIHIESGLYVHREIELRVNPKRLEIAPERAKSGAVSKLNTCHFFPLGTSSSYINRHKFEIRGNFLVWFETTHLNKDDLTGRTSRGASVKWEKEGETTISDVMEIFDLPAPVVEQLDNWSEWKKADRSRGGIFAWHAEANKHPEEIVKPHEYPFEMRFRLVLSKRMYPG